jgi:hypothetical protein
MADITTMKLTTATRDRLRALGAVGESLEDVVIAALDAYESQQFWAAAEAADLAESATHRTERLRAEAEADARLDRLR